MRSPGNTLLGVRMAQAQDKYRALLIEIKRRTKVIDAFLSQQAHAFYVPTTIESSCLQLRKILELIAFGSLVANLDEFSKQHQNSLSIGMHH